ncbi:glycosyltransferase [Mesorhizobium sp. PAMC28654]|uniref:glycosyltransferase n=1 Tax=Mesorhizobium sp. PAMC28654 TaxID=2880934 RepID=UPI001D0B82E9|nr:glycosyltransferase [Mesorhizobium sp. PAMC28654]UDL90341.1 glycosyltransferase [Mesorhizobium sp. PAMC28654]
MNALRFHVVGLPHTQVAEAFSACAFTNKVKYFCQMMKDRGHAVFLYAGEQNEATCDEHIVCISEAARAAHVGDGHYTAAPWDTASPAWRSFNLNAAGGIVSRHRVGDFVCLIGGVAHKPIADLLPEATVVEFGVGYGGCFARHKVFESNAWMHTVYGARSNGDPCAVDGEWWDAVIPGYLDPAEFPFRGAERLLDDYYLFVGRLIDRKGFAIAQEVCEAAGKRLVLAGPGEQTGYGVFTGVVGPKARGILMRDATALLMPTRYIEPFGNVAIEAMACGTPVISTDFGAMTETVIDGVTGIRCRTFGEFLRALEAVKHLDRAVCRQHVIDNYSLDVIGAKYERYFERLGHLWNEGWYEGKAA